MAKILLFSGVGYTGSVKEFQSNDPDLTLNGDDFQFNSAIVASGDWSLYDAVNEQGNTISLMMSGGPDADGTYKDAGDWGGAGVFHVKSIRHS